MRYPIFALFTLFFVGCAAKDPSVARIAGQDYTMSDMAFKIDALESRQNRKDEEIKSLKDELKAQKESIERLDNLVRMQEVVAKRLAEAAKSQKELLSEIKVRGEAAQSGKMAQEESVSVQKQTSKMEPQAKSKTEEGVAPKLIRSGGIGLTNFAPTTFVLKRDAQIFNNSEGGEILDNWASGKSFTAYQKSGNRVRISGYFVNKQWSAAPKMMWIDEDAVEMKK